MEESFTHNIHIPTATSKVPAAAGPSGLRRSPMKRKNDNAIPYVVGAPCLIGCLLLNWLGLGIVSL
ncbi:hypothetical protein TSUD_02140 [Trifolium subterraneum]|nr:hypothetical protein TSUD_02140 [Trifolium subterraneum]